MHFARRALVATLTSLALLAPLAAGAQAGYPGKPIPVIVPFAAGSTTDIIARAIADKMGQSTGQALVIDNRGGFAGFSEVEIFSTGNWWQRDHNEVLDTCISRHRSAV